MNIAEKILRARADLDSVYDAGVEKGRGEATDGVIVEPLEVAANGTYTAPNGRAYSPVKVNVPDVNGSYDEGYEDGYEVGKADGTPEDLNDVLTAQEEKLAELSAILDKKAEGGDTEEAYEQGVADGRQAEYDAFWDDFQENGNKTNYIYAFAGYAWNANNFRPKYDLKPDRCDYMFASTKYLMGVDLTSHLKACGVVLDTSNSTNFSNFLRYESPKRIPVIDTRAASNLNDLSVNSSVETIDKIILRDDGSQTVTTMFLYMHKSLRNINFEGVIGTNFKMPDCSLLSHDSLMSIINALKDYSSSGQTYTLTLGATNLAKLSDAEKLIATQKGWTLA